MPKTATIDIARDRANKVQRKIFWEAVVLALLVHLLLLVLFNYETPAPGYRAAGSPGVSFMSIANLPVSQKRQLQNWLEYHEPSMISAPHPHYGYNQLAPQLDFRKARADHKLKTLQAEIPPSKLQAFKSLEPHAGPQTDLYGNYILYHPPRMFQASEKPPTEDLPVRKYPLVQAGSKVLDFAFSPELLKQMEKINAKTMEIDYQSEADALFPRVRVLKSSGNCDFDMAVLHQLSLPLAAMAKGDGNLNISIKWRKEDAE